MNFDCVEGAGGAGNYLGAGRQGVRVGCEGAAQVSPMPSASGIDGRRDRPGMRAGSMR